MTSGGSSQNTLVGRAPSGGPISSRWEKWVAWTKSEGAEGPPRPRTATPNDVIKCCIALPSQTQTFAVGSIRRSTTSEYYRTQSADYHRGTTYQTRLMWKFKMEAAAVQNFGKHWYL